MEKVFYVIKEDDIYQSSLNSAIEEISEIPNPVWIGYDIHLGFNFPDNQILFQLLSMIYDKQVIIEPIGIDEREQSGRIPFFPTQVYVEINGVVVRKRVAKSKSTFLSQIKCDREKIKNLYYEFSFGKEIEELMNKIPFAEQESLGEFLLKMHCEILKNQLSELNNVSILNPQYNKLESTTGKVHDPSAHVSHDVLYIPLHKRQYKRIAEKFKEARSASHLYEKPYLILLPELSQTYFRKGGE